MKKRNRIISFGMSYWRDALPAERVSGESLIGRPVQVYWDGDLCYYVGRVKS